MTITLIVLDSVGVGALPDAKKFGDAGAHTLDHTLEATGVVGVDGLQLFQLRDASQKRPFCGDALTSEPDAPHRPRNGRTGKGVEGGAVTDTALTSVIPSRKLALASCSAGPKYRQDRCTLTWRNLYAPPRLS